MVWGFWQADRKKWGGDVMAYVKILYIENKFDIQTILISNNSTLK